MYVTECTLQIIVDRNLVLQTVLLRSLTITLATIAEPQLTNAQKGAIRMDSRTPLLVRDRVV